MPSHSAVPANEPGPDDTDSAPTVKRLAAVAYRRAWLSLLLYPLSFVGAFLVGEGLADVLGYRAGGVEVPPLGIALAAGGPALVLFAVPGVLAVYFGRRSMRLGKREGITPAVVGATISLAFIGQNAIAYIAQRFSG